MDFANIKLPADMIDTIEQVYVAAKRKNPNINESKFFEKIFSHWLNQFEKSTEVLSREKVVLKNNLKQAFKISSKSQKQIADEIGVSRTYLSQVANSKYEPSITLALLLLRALDYPPSKIGELFYLEPLE